MWGFWDFAFPPETQLLDSRKTLTLRLHRRKRDILNNSVEFFVRGFRRLRVPFSLSRHHFSAIGEFFRTVSSSRPKNSRPRRTSDTYLDGAHPGNANPVNAKDASIGERHYKPGMPMGDSSLGGASAPIPPIPALGRPYGRLCAPGNIPIKNCCAGPKIPAVPTNSAT